MQNNLHLISLCFLVSEQQRWVWDPFVSHHHHCQGQSCSRESPTVVGGFVSYLLVYCKYILHRKYGIRHDHTVWCTNKVTVVYCATVCSVWSRSSWFLLHRKAVAYDYKKPSLDGLPVIDRIFFSQAKCRNFVKIGSTNSLHSIISSLEQSFKAS